MYVLAVQSIGASAILGIYHAVRKLRETNIV